MSLVGLLGIASNGLQAAQAGASLAGQNASNVNTPGYSRKVLVAHSVSAGDGGGPVKTTIQRVTSPSLETRVLGAQSSTGQADTSQGIIATIDNAFAAGPGDIGSALDAFESAMGNLSANSSDPGARNALLGAASTLAVAFNQTAGEIQSARDNSNAIISQNVATLNNKLQLISDMNSKISQAQNIGNDPSDIQDARDQLERDVASIVPIKVIPDALGRDTVLLNGGQVLVAQDGSVVNPFSTGLDLKGDATIQLRQSGATVDVTNQISTGSIGGALAARETAVIPAQAKLDQLAHDVITAYNNVHKAGYGLDGVTGRNLFTPPPTVAGSALGMSVSSDVAGNPNAVAAAQDPTAVTGDNSNALAMQALSSFNLALSGTNTANGSLSTLISGVGGLASTANVQQEQAKNLSDQITSLAASVTGVSTNEEMISLTSYQSAYQASMKVVQTANDMMQTLLALQM